MITAFKISRIDILLFILFFWGIVEGYFNSELQLGSIFYSEWLLLFLIYAFVSRTTKDSDYALFFLLSIGFIQACVAFAQNFNVIVSGNDFFPVTGFMTNPASLGCMQSVATVSSWSLVSKRIDSFRWSSAALYAGISVFIALTVILSDSRAAFVSMIIGLSIMLLERNEVSIKKLLLWLLMLFLIVLCLFAVLRMDSVKSRVLIWNVSLRLFSEHPMFGLGPGNFNMHYMLSQAEYFSQFPESSFVAVADNVAYPYNEFIHIAVEFGLVGIVLVAMIIHSVCRAPKYGEALPLLASLLAFSCFSFPTYDKNVSWLFPFILGVSGCGETSYSFNIKPAVSISAVFAAIVLSLGNVIYLVTLHGKMQGYLSNDKILDPQCYDVFDKTWTDHDVNRLFFNKLVTQNEQLNVDAMRKIFPMSETWCYWGSIMEDIGEPCIAEFYYRTSACMVPTRIRPRYQLWKMMIGQNRDGEAHDLSRKILTMPIKCENTFTLRVSREIRDYYNLEECHE